MALLNAQDVARIEAAIEAVEACTAGELVVAVVGRSDGYHLPRCVCAGAWGLAAMLLVSQSAVNWPAALLLLGQVPLWGLIWFLLGFKPILRRLSGGLHTNQMVRRRAMQLFMAHGLYQTRVRSGLLIMVSELEHRVVILGDAGIHAHIGEPGWQTHVDAIVAGIKRGETAVAIQRCLETLGKTLAEHFPARPNDVNELSNRVVIEA